MSLPAGAEDRTTFEGYQTTKRTVKMTEEARFLYLIRGGGAYPGISQGGYNAGGVAASAGTHDRDAMDEKLRLLASTEQKLLWEWVNWMVGFAGWRRSYIAGLWVEHFHKLPKDGDLSDGAKKQIVQWYQGDNALKSDKPYPRILSSGLVNRTWEKWLDLVSPWRIDLSAMVAAFEAGKKEVGGVGGGNDVQQIQERLNLMVGSSLVVDGIPGSATKGVYATYQSRLFGVPKGTPDANGIPGKGSLTKLHFTVLA